jgi:hypothetical protein
MIGSLKKTVRTAGKYVLVNSVWCLVTEYRVTFTPLILLKQRPNIRKFTGARGLFDGISGTLLRQMSYSLCRFWAYDESKKIVAPGKNPAAWRLALAGSMGQYWAFSKLQLANTMSGKLGVLLVLLVILPRPSWSECKAISQSPLRSGSTTSIALMDSIR